MGPVAAPVGITNDKMVEVALETGAGSVPPPAWTSVTCGVAPFGVKFVPVTVIIAPTDADVGLKLAMVGPALKVTLSDCVAVFPARSVACTPIEFAPCVRVSEQANDPLCTVPAAPLHVSAATADSASETLPETVRAEEVRVAPLVGDVMLNTGGVLSRLIVVETVDAFPATSVAMPVTS